MQRAFCGGSAGKTHRAHWNGVDLSAQAFAYLRRRPGLLADIDQNALQRPSQLLRVRRAKKKEGGGWLNVSGCPGFGCFLKANHVVAQVADQVLLEIETRVLFLRGSVGGFHQEVDPVEPLRGYFIDYLLQRSPSLWPSIRQRWNFTASAGTNGGALVSLASPARILNKPWRAASGTPMETWSIVPSLESCKLKARVFRPAKPSAPIILSGFRSKGLGASGFSFLAVARIKVSTRALALTHPNSGDSRNRVS